MASCCGDAGTVEVQCKTEWPELVTTGEQAKRIIEAQNPKLRVIVLEEGTPTDRMYDRGRVRIWVKKETGIVYAVPRVG